MKCVMELVKLFLILTTSLLSHAAKNPCPPQYCGTNPLPIRFPFTLQQHPGNCTGFPGLTFTCSVDEGRGDVPLLHLPHSGSFSVRHINYLMQEIHLYDPAGCLPSRLISLNLTSSPFAAALTEELTFLSCPRGAGLAEVECLRNATSAVLAGPAGRLSGAMGVCRTMFTVPIAVPWDGSGGGGDWVTEDLRLTWSLPECQGCEVGGGVCGLGRNRSGVVGEITCYSDHGTGRGLEVFKTIALSIVIPAIICSICISCFVCIVEWKAVRSRAAAVAAPSLHPPATVGLDDSTIESYEKVVLGESKRLPGPNGVTCPICLVDYCPKDILRCIPECQHCFHSECVDEWLRLNSSCPLCRNSPSNSLEQV